MADVCKPPRSIGVSQVGRLLGCDEGTVRRLIDEGLLEAYRLRPRGWWHVSYESVVAYTEKIRTKYGI